MFGRTDNAHIILGFKVELKSQMAFMRKLKRREAEGNADSEMQYNEKSSLLKYVFDNHFATVWYSDWKQVDRAVIRRK